jgi:DNA polymerase-3 subunit delta
MGKDASDIYCMYAVVGSDRFLRNQAIEPIVALLEATMESLGPLRVDGAGAELAEVLDELRTMSLLGGRRAVIVDEADPFITAHRKALERYCSNPADHGCLILACSNMPKNTRLYKIISNGGTVISCEPPARRAMGQWIVRWALEKYGKTVTGPAVQALREHLGDAPGVLDAELSKLAAFVGERSEITPVDIDTLTGHHREEKVFAITDAMSSGDTATALRHWAQVLATDRAAPGRAIAGLAWGVRRLLEARRDLDAGANIWELARRMYVDPDILERRLARTSTTQLEDQQRELLDADLAVKTGGAALDSVVERFIVRHSTGGASSGRRGTGTKQ